MTASRISIYIIGTKDAPATYLKLQLEKNIIFKIIGLATVGEICAQQVAKLKPDIVLFTLQENQPEQYALLRAIVNCLDAPVLGLAATPAVAMEAIRIGAADTVVQLWGAEAAAMKSFLLLLESKIRILTRVYNHARFGTNLLPSRHVIAIGASMGGVEATQRLLQHLPVDLPGIVIVQHMPAAFTKSYAERLDTTTPFSVREAANGDMVCRGQVLLAQGGRHLRVYRGLQGFYVMSEKGEPVNGFCPSVDVLFHSVAAAAGPYAAGILLTGIGRDGAQGLLAMHAAGARTWGQSRESCVVYGMPGAAKKIGAVDEELSIETIGSRVAARFKNL